ncbi:MAG TPA: RDD family protein, partial [Burkholderiaceae bacterium]|nr:RDD family protein [Burkholderiaceae bacterium]
MAPNEGVQYVGFWARAMAALIDSALILLIIAPLLYWFYGPAYFAPMLDSFYGPASSAGPGLSGPVEFLLNWVFPAIAVIVFWIYRQATPGKMIIGAKIVDANTGGPPSTGQLIGRYL